MSHAQPLRATLLVLLAALLGACGAQPYPGTEAAPTQVPAAQATEAPAAAQATEVPANAQAPTDSPAAQATEAPADAQGGTTVTIGIGGAPDSLNPGTGYLAESYDIWELTYETLLHLNNRDEYEPWLAESFEISDDGTEWTVTLRDDSTWSDGQPVTAEDVAFTYNMMIGFESFGYFKEMTSFMTEVTAVDPTTVRFTLEQPVANVEERLMTPYILPKHIWEQFASEEEALAFENVPPVGSGPFTVEEYRPGEFTRLQARKDHWTQPKVDAVIYRTYANPDALVQAIRAGEVDMITELPAATVPTLRSEADITVSSAPSRGLRDIVFNVLDPEDCPAEAVCSGHPALRDLVVRQALAHATDKQQLIDVAYLGLAEPGLTLMPASIDEYYNTELVDYAFDPERARTMLEEAGYTDSDGDGVREMPGDPSKPLRFRTFVPSDQLTGPREAELISQMWQEVGVAIEVQVLDPDTVTSLCCPSYDYDVMIWGWISGPDPASLLTAALTRAIADGTGETGYSNPEYDALFDEQAVTIDKEKRKELIFKMQEILLRDVPYIVPYYSYDIQAFRSDRFTGWALPDGGILYLQDRQSIINIEPVAG
jgi:peptide/nickel transport system substrate-binding protein